MVVVARANGFGRQLIQKIRSIQKKNPNAQLTTDGKCVGKLKNFWLKRFFFVNSASGEKSHQKGGEKTERRVAKPRI